MTDIQPSPDSADNVSSLNKAIPDGRQNGAEWVVSPEGTVKHLFPPLSHDSGPELYAINKDVIPATECMLTITEEGPIDDEVSDERHTVHFQTRNGRRTIADVKHEIKRRR